MTGAFDNLVGIRRSAEDNPKLEKIAFWLVDICVSEANTRKKGFNFDAWSKRDRAKTIKALYGDKWLKYDFLNVCHDVLDHADWHLKVFNRDTQLLIYL